MLPKPEPRPPKPRKRIAVRSVPKRSVKPRKKRKGKRASLARECDRLWSLIVKCRIGCEALVLSCCENLYSVFQSYQAAHGFSRRYRATRWLPINGFRLCRACHVYYTHRPLEWDVWLREAWGEPAYTELRYLALKNEKQDMPSVLAKLRAEADKLGIK